MSEPALSQTTFSAVLDELIPARDASLPGAGSLGIGEYVETQLGPLVSRIADALVVLDERAGERGAAGFAELARAERAPLLNEVAAARPGFIESLIFHTYCGYYQHPSVVVAIGMEARPPHPLGYPLEAGNLDLLDEVRRRDKMYREV